MVKGFEEYSYEITPFEKKHILPFIVESWEKVALHDKVSMNAMIRTANKFCVEKNLIKPTGRGKGKIYKTDGPRMRKVIHTIRVLNLVPGLIATSKGYFKTNDKEEIEAFIQSCRSRANSFNEVANAMEKHNG